MSALPALPLSVLDVAPVRTGGTVREALRNSLDLAAHVERLGFTRFWVAEHHNMPGIASSSPAVLLAHLAGVTSTIRLGSGGVMLPNHAPLTIAEQFGMLEALHPGRIDLGLGRAPGTDQLTAQVLRRTPGAAGADDFPRQLGELLAFFNGGFPAGDPRGNVTAVPGLGLRPEVWLLGSSGYSAQLAGMLAMPFAFAHHFSARNTVPALQLYRSSFRPAPDAGPARVLIVAPVICADDDEQARWLAGPAGLSFLRLRSGRPGPYPSPEEAAAYSYSAFEREVVADRLSTMVVGGPETVESGLAELIERTGTDELMVTTMTHGHADRLRSFSLVAGLFDLPSAAGTGTEAPVAATTAVESAWTGTADVGRLRG